MAQAILKTINFQYEPIDYAEFDRHIQIARNQLGKARFDVLAFEDHAMTLEQAVEYALQSSGSS